MTRPKIEMMPVPDTSHIYDYQKMMLDRIAAAFALPYHLLAPGPIIRTHLGDIQHSSAWEWPKTTDHFCDDNWHADMHTRMNAIWRKALDEYHRRHEAACWVYLVDYDPQKLLSDQRCG